MARISDPWMRLAFDTWSLGMEASAVIGLRSWKMAMGGAAAEREGYLMVDEKIQTGLALQALALTGRLGATPHRAASRTVNYYRRKVRANRRRLHG